MHSLQAAEGWCITHYPHVILHSVFGTSTGNTWQSIQLPCSHSANKLCEEDKVWMTNWISSRTCLSPLPVYASPCLTAASLYCHYVYCRNTSIPTAVKNKHSSVLKATALFGVKKNVLKKKIAYTHMCKAKASLQLGTALKLKYLD